MKQFLIVYWMLNTDNITRFFVLHFDTKCGCTNRYLRIIRILKYYFHSECLKCSQRRNFNCDSTCQRKQRKRKKLGKLVWLHGNALFSFKLLYLFRFFFSFPVWLVLIFMLGSFFVHTLDKKWTQVVDSAKTSFLLKNKNGKQRFIYYNNFFACWLFKMFTFELKICAFCMTSCRRLKNKYKNFFFNLHNHFIALFEKLKQK